MRGDSPRSCFIAVFAPGAPLSSESSLAATVERWPTSFRSVLRPPGPEWQEPGEAGNDSTPSGVMLPFLSSRLECDD